MGCTPEIALSVVTYQRPRSLALVLESIAAQRGVDGLFELVVTDDGSTDNTLQVVEDFRQRVNFPVKFVTHPRVGFQAGRCRNEGAAATHAPYLLFLDGDCVLPPHHVAMHLQHRRKGVALAGDVCRLDALDSDRVTAERIRGGDFSQLHCEQEKHRLQRLDFKYRLYNFLHHPTKPRSLRSGDFGIWRSDFQQVNGFDENFCGWGGEDDDLGRRLRRAGIKLQSILRWTHSYHLWHAPDVSVPALPSAAPNAQYMLRKGRLTCCRNGLKKRSWNDLGVRVVGHTDRPQEANRWMTAPISQPHANTPRTEVEVLFLPGNGRFSGAADCNVLVALEDSPKLRRLASQAHIVVAPRPLSNTPDVLQFTLDQWDQALAAVA